jgi:TolA-binding protein
MYDDAILQFETVLNKFPRGNKVHDSRYMLGMTYSKKGETSRAVEVLEGALRKNPPAEVRGKILAQLNQIQ